MIEQQIFFCCSIFSIIKSYPNFALINDGLFVG